MIIIAKVILITFLIALLFFYFIKVRSRRMDRLIFMVLLLAGIVFVINPDITSAIANRIGITRGADLIFYLSIIFFFFGFILLYSRNKELERKITDLVSNDAIENARE